MERSDEGAKLTFPSDFPYLILPYLHLFLKDIWNFTVQAVHVCSTWIWKEWAHRYAPAIPLLCILEKWMHLPKKYMNKNVHGRWIY